MTLAPLYFGGKVIVGISGGEMGARGSVTAYRRDQRRPGVALLHLPGLRRNGRRRDLVRQRVAALRRRRLVYTPSVDPDRGLVYFGVGNPDPWSDRGPGDNRSRTRSSHSTSTPGRRGGGIRPSTTTSGTTTSRARPCSSTSP